jgi:hypothetical protein
MEPTRDDWDKIGRAAAKSRRSALFLWLYDNHAAFAAAVSKAGRPNWKELSKAFSELGLTDRLGHPPTPEGARQTWFHVRKAVRQASQRTSTHAAPPSPQPDATLTPTRPGLDAGDGEEAVTLTAASGKPISVRIPKHPGATTTGPALEPAADDAAEEVVVLRGLSGKTLTTVRLPKK